RAARSLAVEQGGRCDRVPRIAHLVDAGRGDPGARETLDQGSGHGDDRVELSEGPALQPLKHSVLPSATRKTMHGRDDWNSQAPRDTRVYNVGPVPVRVDDVGAELAAPLSDGRALGQVRSIGYDERVRVHARRCQGREKRVRVP